MGKAAVEDEDVTQFCVHLLVEDLKVLEMITLLWAVGVGRFLQHVKPWAAADCPV